jgi:hypothetical protein
MARSTMANLITRVRLLINDPSGGSQTWTDDQIQDVLDASRQDVLNSALTGKPTFSGTTIQYLDYFASQGDWEDSPVMKQYLTVVVNPSASENIVGHWTFAQSVLPPVFITGKSYDIFRAAAELLERWSAKLALNYDFTSDGQTFRRSQAGAALCNLAKTYRMQQRPTTISLVRADIGGDGGLTNPLGPSELDYMASG